MIYPEPLFLGVTPTGARNYVADKVASLEKPFFNACAGRFSVVEAAIKAGVDPQNIHASDIGLFSSIIGYLADPSKNLDDLGIRIIYRGDFRDDSFADVVSDWLKKHGERRRGVVMPFESQPN